MYKTVQRSSRRAYGHNVREGSRRQRTLARERVRLTQLAVCAALFAVVFIGKGVFPQRLTQLQEDLQALLSSDTDFRAALADLGENLAGKGPVLGELGDFCVQVFGPSQEEELLAPSVQVQEAQDFLNQQAGTAEKAAYYLHLDQVRPSALGVRLQGPPGRWGVQVPQRGGHRRTDRRTHRGLRRGHGGLHRGERRPRTLPAD